MKTTINQNLCLAVGSVACLCPAVRLLCKCLLCSNQTGRDGVTAEKSSELKSNDVEEEERFSVPSRAASLTHFLIMATVRAKDAHLFSQ